MGETAFSKADATGLILAGGAGRRVSGRDKGLILWQDQPLIKHVCAKLTPQVDKLVINCNRSHDEYRHFAPTVISDQRSGFVGPLAGLEAAASCIDTQLTVLAPCDSPALPNDLVMRLLQGLCAPGSNLDIAYAHDGNRSQYLCAVIRTECLATTTAFLDKGGRAVKDWYATRRSVAVDFSDSATAFANINVIDSAV